MLKNVYYYNSHKKQQILAFSAQLRKMIGLHWNYGDEIQILCIGTDKVCGDSLGPFVGHYLSKLIPDVCCTPMTNSGRLSSFTSRLSHVNGLER